MSNAWLVDNGQLSSLHFLKGVGELLAAEAATYHHRNHRPFVGNGVKALKGSAMDGKVQALTGTLVDGETKDDAKLDPVIAGAQTLELKKTVRFAPLAKTG